LKQITFNAELLAEAARLILLVRHQPCQVSDPSAIAPGEHAPKRLVSLLQFELDSKDQKIRELQTKLSVAPKQFNSKAVYRNGDPETIEQAMQETCCGYNPLSITSYIWHKKNPSRARTLFGFNRWAMTKSYLNAFFEMEHEVPTLDWLSK
jgi:hypothetical protein